MDSGQWTVGSRYDRPLCTVHCALSTMKITEVRTLWLRQELGPGERFAYSQAWVTSRSALLVEIHSDSGLVGLGEAFGAAPAPIKATIDDIYAPLLLGRDPFAHEVLWQEMYNRLRDHGQKGVPIEALSALDIALWDLKGKALGMPVSRLLGGPFRRDLPAYATGLYRRAVADHPAALAEEAGRYAAQGFGGVKLKVGFGLKEDERAVRAVRGAVGPGVRLMIDANHGYNARTAIQLGRRIAEYDIEWFEEPVPPEDLEGYLEVKQALPMPIAGGEAEFTRFGFRHLLARRALDIAQPDVCVTGGITEALHIAHMAAAWNVQTIPHVWGSGVAVSAALHFAAALPDYPPGLYPAPLWFERDCTPNELRDRLCREPVAEVRDGRIAVPESPGLGVTLDPAVVQRYRVG